MLLYSLSWDWCLLTSDFDCPLSVPTGECTDRFKLLCKIQEPLLFPHIRAWKLSKDDLTGMGKLVACFARVDNCWNICWIFYKISKDSDTWYSCSCLLSSYWQLRSNNQTHSPSHYLHAPPKSTDRSQARRYLLVLWNLAINYNKELMVVHILPSVMKILMNLFNHHLPHCLRNWEWVSYLTQVVRLSLASMVDP